MNTNRPIYLFILFLATSFLFSSCEVALFIDDDRIEGNGFVETEYRMTYAFNKIAVSGPYRVYVEYGNDWEISVTAESNLVPYIETEVSGHTLYIDNYRYVGLLDNNFPMEIHIVTPELRALTLSGSGYIYVADFFNAPEVSLTVSGSGGISAAFNCDELNAVVSGPGYIEVEGDAYYTDMFMSGSGRILAFDLLSQYCDATISGSGKINVNVEELLDVNISGSGDLFYINYPSVNYAISGSGDVIDAN